MGAWPHGPAGGRLVAEAPQSGTDLAEEDLGLLESGAVSAPVGFAVVDRVAVGVLDPVPGQRGLSRGNMVTATGNASFGPATVADRSSQWVRADDAALLHICVQSRSRVDRVLAVCGVRDTRERILDVAIEVLGKTPTRARARSPRRRACSDGPSVSTSRPGPTSCRRSRDALWTRSEESWPRLPPETRRPTWRGPTPSAASGRWRTATGCWWCSDAASSGKTSTPFSNRSTRPSPSWSNGRRTAERPGGTCPPTSSARWPGRRVRHRRQRPVRRELGVPAVTMTSLLILGVPPPRAELLVEHRS